MSSGRLFPKQLNGITSIPRYCKVARDVCIGQNMPWVQQDLRPVLTCESFEPTRGEVDVTIWLRDVWATDKVVRI